MIFSRRPEPPACLTQTTRYRKIYGVVQNQVAWGLQYGAKRNNQSKSNDFAWATFNGQKVNQLIEDALRNMTQNHCAFCDIFPLRQSGPTIEHFRPKESYPSHSYLWDNLFYCCYTCQKSKLTQFDQLLLKPDLPDYSFERYFIYRTDGEAIEIRPNPRATRIDKRRAETTLRLYGLNDHERPEARYTEWLKFEKSVHKEINDWPYRFLFINM